MQCKEARNKIASGKIDPDVLAHCQDCTGCGRFLEAARLTLMVLSSTQPEENIPSMQLLRDEVCDKLSSQSRLEIVMNSAREQIHSRPRLVLGTAVTALVIGLCTLVPFSYEQTVGYDLAYCCVDESQLALTEVLEANLAASGYQDARVEFEKAKELYHLTVRNLPTKAAANYYSGALALMAADKPIMEIAEVTKETAATLFAQARDEYRLARSEGKKPSPIKVRLNADEAININGYNIRDIIAADSLTDEEISEELREIFAGDDPELEDLVVRVLTDEDEGERLIVVGSESRRLSAFEAERYLDRGLTLDDVYGMVKGEGDEKTETDTGAVEIVIPSEDKVEGRFSIIMKVDLREYK